MMPALIANTATVVPSLFPSGIAKCRSDTRLQTRKSFLAMPCNQSKLFKGVQIVSYAQRQPCKVGAYVASQNARCAAQQTETLKRKKSTISILPSQGMKSPKLDDGGTGFPPKDGGGGGGGGGDGSSSSGGFFLFGFLLFLSYLKDQEEEGSRKYN